MVCPRCGHIFIKQAVWFYCPVGRGDPTPPGSFAITAKGKEGSRPLPTNNQKVSSYRQSNYFRQVVGDAYMRPVRFTRYIVISGRLQRAAYMPPLRSTRNIRYNIRSRVGACPAPTGWRFCILESAQIFPSSVTCGDSFPPRGSLSGGIKNVSAQADTPNLNS